MAFSYYNFYNQLIYAAPAQHFLMLDGWLGVMLIIIVILRMQNKGSKIQVFLNMVKLTIWGLCLEI
jgi:hypothetical protein